MDEALAKKITLEIENIDRLFADSKPLFDLCKICCCSSQNTKVRRHPALTGIPGFLSKHFFSQNHKHEGRCFPAI